LDKYIESVYQGILDRDPLQKEFHQAANEVLETLEPVIEKYPVFKKHKILERIVEPERIVQFRVPWKDRNDEIQINRGYRVQYNSAIGPYKGGFRFHPTVVLGMLKFLGFEQTFKNSLTTLPNGRRKRGFRL
jgi:glutamate dehydrogenase (NADP+)